MSEVKKVLFIVNKFAGRGYESALEGRITDLCGQQNVECSIAFTTGRGHATSLAQDAARLGFASVVAVGGDGTLNEVAKGLLGSGVPMGIIPRGSGNGLARHLGIPLKFPLALKSVFNSENIAMDVFHLNGKLSINVSGIGFDGNIANLFSTATRRGLTGYTRITLQEFFRFAEFEAELMIDEKKFSRKAFIIAIANSSQYGNNARIVPAASVRDQLLHINILKKVPPYRFDFLYNFFSGNIEKSRFCEMLETPALQIKTTKPVPYHVDGEPCGAESTFEIQLTPAALHVLVPATNPRRAYL